MRLGPQEKRRVAVTYDAGHVVLRHSRDDTGALVVSFAEHPLVEEIPLSAAVRSVEHVDSNRPECYVMVIIIIITILPVV